jgi:hypothetical protein
MERVFGTFLVILGSCFMMAGILTIEQLTLPLWYWLIPAGLMSTGITLIIIKNSHDSAT